MSERLNGIIGPGSLGPMGCLEHWSRYPCPTCTAKRQRWVAELKTIWEAMHMSWSAYARDVAPGDAVAQLRKQFAQQYPTPTEEVVEQFDSAIWSVEHLLPAVLPREGLVTVTISGHANPGHLPTPGWANDCLRVSVTQK